MTKHYQMDKRYSHKPLVRAGARLKWVKSNHHPLLRPTASKVGYWVLCVHVPCENGDGGVLYSFVRKGRKWQNYGCGRLRYCEHRDLFPEIDIPNKQPA